MNRHPDISSLGHYNIWHRVPYFVYQSACDLYRNLQLSFAKNTAAIEKWNMLYDSFILNFNICMWFSLEIIDSHAFCNEIVRLFYRPWAPPYWIIFRLHAKATESASTSLRRESQKLCALGKHFRWTFSGGVEIFKVFWSSGRPLLCFARFWPSENVARIRRVYVAYSRTKSVHTRNIASNAKGNARCILHSQARSSRPRW